MIMQIPNVLSQDDINEILNALDDKALWQEGTATAMGPAGSVKNNIQASTGHPEVQNLTSKIATILARNILFTSATRPEKFLRPTFNSYSGGMAYGEHVDSAHIDNHRTDISMTLFLTEPNSYEGGELVIHSQVGQVTFKQPAGTLVLYPSTHIHCVKPVSSGKRVCYFGWIKSQVRYPHQREMLFEMDKVITNLSNKGVPNPDLVPLISIRNNVMREWSD